MSNKILVLRNKRCKHLNGTLKEFVEAAHIRDIIDGLLEEFGDNSLGNILYYEFKCRDCKKIFRFKANPSQKFLKNIYDQYSLERSGE